ncbi:heat shock protein DnaJ domain protein [Firmicutes bacterium CAG:475]|jgi:heat shock protein dnaJ domain protein|nr:hypothetical protein [Bacillota bacterium]CDD68529.1 heat shock protein DnaJ domain protein [Firmicutes bacterium CAG:475]
MPIDPFVILGISKDSSQSEILEAYKTKRAYYQEHVFDEGDQGAQAARMLGQLDDAYQQAMELSHESATVSGEGESSFESVRDSIRNKDVEGAQRALDEISYRGAEWHYYQSIVFYEKNWLNDSKKQLEMAIQMDPSNDKYSRALDNLKKKIDGSRPYDKQGEKGVYGKSDQTSNRTYSQRDSDVADGLCTACQALWCADCCCECMGGDLIRCC